MGTTQVVTVSEIPSYYWALNQMIYVWLYTTNYMKQSPCETSSLSASQDIFRILCSREPAICPYPGPD